MSTKTIKAGLSKANVNAIAGAIGTATLNRLVPQFSTSVSYTQGQYTNYNNQLYRFTSDKSAGAWDSSKVESASLNDLIDDVNGAVASVTGKANTQDLLNGTLVPSKALTAEQIENVGEDVGSTQDAPFIFQATATDNGADSVETAPVAKHLRKLGNSVVVNQLIPNQTISGTSNGITIGSSNDGKYVITVNNATGFYQIDLTPTRQWLSGHKYLVITKSIQNIQVYIANYNVGVSNSYIATITNTQNAKAFLFVGQDTPNGTYNVEPKIIDLTQWFGSNDLIPSDLLTHPENAGRYGMLGLAYNEGTLTNCNGQYLECIGRNQWDEEWELGSIDTNGQPYNANNAIRGKANNPIRIVPNVSYKVSQYGTNADNIVVYFYDKNDNFIPYTGFGAYNNAFNTSYGIFTAPSNAYYIRFRLSSSYGTTYNHDITISLYYEDGTGYSDYYQFVKNTYDTGTETLRSAGSVKDSKLPSGEITRKVGNIKLNSLSWDYESANSRFVASVSGMIAKTNNLDVFCPMYIASLSPIGSRTTDKTICGYSDGKVYVLDSAYTDATTFKNHFTDDDYLYFQLATPTTEQGTAFPENVEVDNYGSMGWLDSNGYVDIPQGCKFFYPADYVEFIDSLYTRSKDGGDSADVNNIVVKSELTPSDNKDTQLQNAIGGTLRQLLAVSKSIDFLNTDVVDLGSLSWEYNSGSNFFYAIVSGLKYETSNILCSKYKTINYGVGIENNCVKVIQQNQIIIRDTNYTDATAFKNAMKGVLLAYEKA